MTKQQLEKAVKINDEINRLQKEMDDLSHHLMKDEFRYAIIDNTTGMGYKFLDEFLPNDRYQFIADYSANVVERIAQLEKELSEL